MFPPLYLCRLFICNVDTHVESHPIKINYVAICSRSKFNLTGLVVTSAEMSPSRSTNDSVSCIFSYEYLSETAKSNYAAKRLGV